MRLECLHGSHLSDRHLEKQTWSRRITGPCCPQLSDQILAKHLQHRPTQKPRFPGGFWATNHSYSNYLQPNQDLEKLAHDTIRCRCAKGDQHRSIMLISGLAFSSFRYAWPGRRLTICASGRCTQRSSVVEQVRSSSVVTEDYGNECIESTTLILIRFEGSLESSGMIRLR